MSWAPLPRNDTKNGSQEVHEAYAVVTGASSGIGAAVAERLRYHGCEVLDISRSSGFDVTNLRDIKKAYGELPCAPS